MTDTQEDPTAEASGRSDRSRRLMIFGIVIVALVAVAAIAIWYFVIRDDSAASVVSSEAAEAREEALEEAAAEPTQEEVDSDSAVNDGSDDEAGAGDGDDGDASGEAAAPESLDGAWTIDTTIGTFDEVCLTEVCDTTFVGFRIDEELASVGAKTVVGRTPGVTGTMELAGTTITSAVIDVDMTQLITDSSSRTNAIRRQAIETDAFPDASFVLTSPVELGALPLEGEQLTVDATGDLTIHGVTRSETIPLTAEVVGDVIVVFGQLGPILLADYNIAKPTAAVVLSVEDNAIMELQLFFTRSQDS